MQRSKTLATQSNPQSVLRRMDSSHLPKQESKPEEAPFEPKKYVKNGLSEHDVLVFKEIFDLIDPSASGFVSPNDLKSALTTIGINLSRADLYNLICDFDESYLGKLNFDDFIQAASGVAKPWIHDRKPEYMGVFKKLSGNKDVLSHEELIRAMRNSGINYSEDDCTEMYAKLGLEFGADITFELFQKAITTFAAGNMSAGEKSNSNKRNAQHSPSSKTDDINSIHRNISASSPVSNS